MISVVIPCYNETEVLELAYRGVVDAAATWGDSFELLLIDDGSSDDTWEIIARLAQRDARVRGLRLSRNFGQEYALGAGLEQARGDAVVVLDADLQDPPSLVAELLARWREGYDVVNAQRRRRDGETWFKKTSADLFYRLLARTGSVDIPRNTGYFGLMDARVVRTLCSLREHSLFWRGLRSWTGFRQTSVLFDRPERAAGVTKYNLRKLLRLAATGLLCFSELPLRLPLYAGGITCGLTLLAAALSLAGHLVGIGDAWRAAPGTLALCFLGGVQMVCLGVMGEYLNRIYDEARDRPRWIVSETVNVELASAQLPQSRRRAG